MDILLYIEPLIESGLPIAKSYWVSNWVPRLAESLKEAFGKESSITLIGGSTFLGDANIPGVRVISLNPWEILDLWENDPDSLLVDAFRWPQSPNAILISKRIKSLLPKINVDLVIVFGANGYHGNLFPDVPILYHEFSLLKAPGPETWYFDQAGPGGSAWFERYWSSFRIGWRPSEEQLLLASRYRDSYRNSIKSKLDLRGPVQRFAQEFDKTVLLPLQMDRVSVFNSFSPVETQFNLALAVWDRLPRSVGLIITEHPRQIGGLTDDSREFLSSLENVLIVREGVTYGPSDEVAPFVDGIATVSSTVGALAFIWGKSLISLTGRYLAPFANHCGPPPWSLPARDDMEDLVILAFIMTHWAVTARQLEDPEWIRRLVAHAIALRSGQADPAKHPVPAWGASRETIEHAWLSPLEN